MYEEEIDYERLRNDLIDYFHTFLSFFPIAIMDLTKVEQAAHAELIKIAINNGIDLDNYKKRNKSL